VRSIFSLRKTNAPLAGSDAANWLPELRIYSDGHVVFKYYQTNTTLHRVVSRVAVAQASSAELSKFQSTLITRASSLQVRCILRKSANCVFLALSDILLLLLLIFSHFRSIILIICRPHRAGASLWSKRLDISSPAATLPPQCTTFRPYHFLNPQYMSSDSPALVLLVVWSIALFFKQR
jgi:hypothetical protein